MQMRVNEGNPIPQYAYAGFSLSQFSILYFVIQASGYSKGFFLPSLSTVKFPPPGRKDIFRLQKRHISLLKQVNCFWCAQVHSWLSRRLIASRLLFSGSLVCQGQLYPGVFDFAKGSIKCLLNSENSLGDLDFCRFGIHFFLLGQLQAYNILLLVINSHKRYTIQNVHKKVLLITSVNRGFLYLGKFRSIQSTT